MRKASGMMGMWKSSELRTCTFYPQLYRYLTLCSTFPTHLPPRTVPTPRLESLLLCCTDPTSGKRTNRAGTWMSCTLWFSSQEPWTTALNCSSGKMVCTGVKSERQAQLSSQSTGPRTWSRAVPWSSPTRPEGPLLAVAQQLWPRIVSWINRSAGWSDQNYPFSFYF